MVAFYMYSIVFSGRQPSFPSAGFLLAHFIELALSMFRLGRREKEVILGFNYVPADLHICFQAKINCRICV